MRYITDMRIAKANNLVVFEIAFSNLQFWETVALLDTKPSLPFGNQHAVIEQNFTVKGLQIRRILWWKQCHIFNGVRTIAPPVRVRVWFRVRVRYRIGGNFPRGQFSSHSFSIGWSQLALFMTISFVHRTLNLYYCNKFFMGKLIT